MLVKLPPTAIDDDTPRSALTAAHERPAPRDQRPFRNRSRPMSPLQRSHRRHPRRHSACCRMHPPRPRSPAHMSRIDCTGGQREDEKDRQKAGSTRSDLGQENKTLRDTEREQSTHPIARGRRSGTLHRGQPVQRLDRHAATHGETDLRDELLALRLTHLPPLSASHPSASASTSTVQSSRKSQGRRRLGFLIVQSLNLTSLCRT